MNPTHLDDPCILFALRRESAAFRREFPPTHAFPGSPCWARFCGLGPRRVLVVETGVGQANVAHVLDWLLAKPTFDRAPYEPRFLVFAGYAGALTEALHVGDVMQADEVVDLEGHSWRTTWSVSMPTLQPGRLLTVDEMTGAPADKRLLADRHQACAVDMESALFAARCTQAGLPFACVRAISDAAATTLSPALVSLLSAGTVSWWRVLLAVGRRPGLLPEFWRLARDTKKASEQLALALRDLLNLTLPANDSA